MHLYLYFICLCTFDLALEFLLVKVIVNFNDPKQHNVSNNNNNNINK